jgi:hypothetical protein
MARGLVESNHFEGRLMTDPRAELEQVHDLLNQLARPVRRPAALAKRARVFLAASVLSG